MRGKLAFSFTASSNVRITPAHAGKTGDIMPARLKARDHPRACGENCFLRGNTRIYKGSPPRMRGKLLIKPCERVLRRITPARAGKTNLRHFFLYFC